MPKKKTLAKKMSIGEGISSEYRSGLGWLAPDRIGLGVSSTLLNSKVVSNGGGWGYVVQYSGVESSNYRVVAGSHLSKKKGKNLNNLDGSIDVR